MIFKSENDFENALVKTLTESCGWEKEVLFYKTEKELIQNWADILFENNRQRERLNDYPLTDGEMSQIIEQINNLKTPLKLNGFINGRSVQIVRDNPDDKENFGKTISLKIYDRKEIAAGQSRYQIARQPKFTAKTDILPNRRGDFTLLINGMPLIHVELKKSGVPVSQACNQIEKYAHEGVFTNFFALTQVFVAMNPEESVYFANPGPEGKFNPEFYFHWANFNNDRIDDWKTVASTLLSIPMAHQLIGFYTVADENDGILKVMRSYQIYAANKISDTVAKNKWENNHQLGGYIWHTTGSGKTMTSFKSAQLIANSKDADKVVFLIDRVELGTQSAREYRGFADETDYIQETEDTEVLISKLKSNNAADTLIVTSIQKMSNIRNDEQRKITQAEIKTINSKRIVFIVDECHRSSFGEMMLIVKETFPTALFFGFSGTPIQIENEKKGNTTADVFGNELHRYSIADGIRDKNVLGFDPDKVLTFKEKDMREVVALEKARASTASDAISDPAKAKIYYKYMNDAPMATYIDDNGVKHTGIEDYMLANGQYRTDEHQKTVVEDMKENWLQISRNYKFHALFATSSIPEAIDYYRLVKKMIPDVHVTCLFDQHIGNEDGNYKEYRGQKVAFFKEEGLVEIIDDYNKRYNQKFTMATYGQMKKDIQNRLAHKKPYERIVNDRDKQLDLLIVVDQMLTGYDSKWINVLYLDKLLKYENIIQAFSRTNRLFDESEKPFGCIKYYRAPYTMEQNINAAVKLYSGDKPLGLFVVKLDKNIENMNAVFKQIQNLFTIAGVEDFSKLPNEVAEKQQFAKLFREFNNYLNAAKIQGFTWDKFEYQFVNEKTSEKKTLSLAIDKKTFLILVLRYKELFAATGTTGDDDDTPYDLTGYITTIDTGKIDADYMNSRFEKFRKALVSGKPEDVESTKEELHKTFATLTQEEQKYANIFLNDMLSGDVEIFEEKTLRDYINEYMENVKNDQIHRCAESFAMDEQQLRNMMSMRLTAENINEFGRLDKLLETADIKKAQLYFEKRDNTKWLTPFVKIELNNLIKKFIITGGFEV